MESSAKHFFHMSKKKSQAEVGRRFQF